MAIFNMGSIVNEPPVLNSSYPADVTIVENASGSATFKVEIATHGIPEEYTYQWYVNNAAVSGATSSTYTKTGLTSAATYTVYCIVTNDGSSVTSRVATLTVKSCLPKYTLNGTTYTATKDTYTGGTYNWIIKITGGSGTFKFTDFGNCTGKVDVCVVGGGGGGSSCITGSSSTYRGGGGGAGAYVTNSSNLSVSLNTGYSYAVASGGAAGTSGANGGGGGTTTFASVSASGGGGGSCVEGYAGHGGSGGGGGGASSSSTRKGGRGGTNGSDGYGYHDVADRYNRGTGAGATTYPFGSTSYPICAGGGGGGSGISSSGTMAAGGAAGDASAGAGGGNSPGTGGRDGAAGVTNRGGGGGAASGRGSGIGPYSGGAGGSGVIYIRNHR